MAPYGIHWFRRDLRIAGNEALQWNFKEHDGRVLGVFCFDSKFLGRKDFSSNRFQVFLETLKSLKKDLRKAGSDLLFLDIGPHEAFPQLLEQLSKQGIPLPQNLTFNRDYEPFARKRDADILKLMNKWEVQAQDFRDHLIIEPWELFRGEDPSAGYQVFTPFSRKWLDIFNQDTFRKRVLNQKNGIQYLKKLEKGKCDKVFKLTWSKLVQDKITFPDVLEEYIEKNLKNVDIPIPKTGQLEAFKKLKEFKNKIQEYGEGRDFPAQEGTSGLSMFLKNGSITTSQIIYFLNLEPYEKKDPSSQSKFFSELIWREFYYHVLYRNPQVEIEAFNSKYKNLNWENNKKFFKAWKEGKTGFPIVDAGMRQLNTTGRMHNRVRMIVASFLTKDLLIDWRWGERYFMEKLLDGDLAPNNGGWQWAASTGCDAQPYFRIFNPWSQSKKFDEGGDYIRTFIPELSHLDCKKLHAPILGEKDYPEPIVDHKEQREKALTLFKKIKE